MGAHRPFAAWLLLLPCLASAQRFDWTSFAEVVSNSSNASSGATTINHDINGDLIIAGNYAEDFIAGPGFVASTVIDHP